MLIIKGLIGGLIQIALFSVVFIIPAGLVPEGTWYWDRALIFIVVYGVILTITILTLAVKAPANLEARLKAPTSRNQPMADRIITTIMTLFMLGWFVFIPIDVFFFKILPAPHIIVSVCGGVLFLLGYAIIVTAIYQNSFATPIVEDQTESGQTLVDTGFYAIVRHPLYLGMLPFFMGLAMWLGSYTALIAVSALLVIFIARITVEEKTLRKSLPGYPEYIMKVHYRLIPFIW